MPGSKISNSPRMTGVFFIHLELRRKYKKDYMNVEESKAGNYRTVNKIVFF